MDILWATSHYIVIHITLNKVKSYSFLSLVRGAKINKVNKEIFKLYSRINLKATISFFVHTNDNIQHNEKVHATYFK